MRPVIPKGATYRAIWEGKEQDFTSDQDRVAYPLGDYMECIKKIAEESVK